jgi:hypothetical protein
LCTFIKPIATDKKLLGKAEGSWFEKWTDENAPKKE